MFLSIVIPAHNEERRLRPTLKRLREYLLAQSYQAEVLVVENGSTDRTAEVTEEFAQDWLSAATGASAETGADPTWPPPVSRVVLRLLREQRRGKGLAVRRGMLEAAGEYRFLCDADLSTPIEELPRFLPPSVNADVAIGSRELAQSAVVEPRWRREVGRSFNRLARALVVPGIRDTQCGFKCFTAAAAECIFRRQRLTGLAFDVELLYIARRHGLKIAEVAVTWERDHDTRVRLGTDTFLMAKDLLAIRRNARRGCYD